MAAVEYVSGYRDRVIAQLSDRLQARAERGLERARAEVNVDTTTLQKSLRITEPRVVRDEIQIDYLAGRTDDANPKTGQPSATYAAKIERDYGTVITPFVNGVIEGGL